MLALADGEDRVAGGFGLLLDLVLSPGDRGGTAAALFENDTFLGEAIGSSSGKGGRFLVYTIHVFVSSCAGRNAKLHPNSTL